MSKLIRALLIFLWIPVSSSSIADDSLTKNAPLTVQVCSLPLPPQTMLNDQNEPDGFAIEVLNDVLKTLNWKAHVSYMPWMRVVQSSKDGKCDISLTVLKRDDYESYLRFPETALLDQANVILTRIDSDVTFDGNLESFLKQNMVGMYRDKAVNDEFETLRYQPWARISLANDPAQNMRKLIHNRVDAVIENSLTATYELRKMGKLNEVKILYPPLNLTPAYFVFPMSGHISDEQIQQFDKALMEYKQTDRYKTISDYYEGSSK